MPKLIHTKSNIKPFACRVTRNGTRNKSITSNLARKGFNKIIPIILASILVGVVCSINVSATQTQIYFGVDVQDATLEISIPPADTLMSIRPTSEGVFGKKEVPVTVATNSYNGYKLQMMVDNSSLTSLTRQVSIPDGNGGSYFPTIDAIPSNNGVGYTEAQFSNVSDKTTMNTWGYSVSSSNYLPIPTKDSPADIRTTSTNSDVIPTTVTFGIKMDTTKPSGEYGTTITFVATANHIDTCVANKICYVGNGGSGGMDMQVATGSTANNSIDTTRLWASNFKNPSGYGFAGWNTEADGTGTNYGPNEDILSKLTASTGLTLYANWIASAGNLQGWSGCSSLAVGSGVTALTDTRDGNTYAVARLADGKCWMIENLRLNNTGSSLSSSNTNVASNWATNGGMVMDTATGSKSLYLNAPSTEASYWCTNTATAEQAACYNQSRLATQNTADSIGFMSASETTNGAANANGNNGAADNNIYSYGNYYNWYSATAGYGTQDNSNTTQVGNTNNYNINNNYSLCPTGWRLPYGGDHNNTATSDFWQLGLGIMGKAPSDGQKYQSTSADAAELNSSSTNANYKGKYAVQAYRMWPNNFICSGNQSASTQNRGSHGFYQSSTASNTQYSYSLNIDSSNVFTGTNTLSKFYGFPVRCVTGS